MDNINLGEPIKYRRVEKWEFIDMYGVEGPEEVWIRVGQGLNTGIIAGRGGKRIIFDELVEEVPVKEEVNIEELGCFDRVARVLPHNDAVYELSRVRKITKGSRGLSGAFPWAETPQGHEFWSAINGGRHPYNKGV